MKKSTDSFESGSVGNLQKKKLMLMIIYITIAVIVCLFTVLLISQAVASIKDKNPENTEASADNNAYVAKTVSSAELHTGNLILVNKDNEYIFADNPDMVSIPTSKLYGLRNNDLMANSTALEAFNDMMKALNSNVDNADIVVTNAYRTKEYQDSLENGTPGGFSDFHTGMSFELKDGDKYDDSYDNLDTLDKYDWLYKNAHKYGFIVRYPADISESSTGKNAGKSYSSITGVDDYAYVFRYVGIAHATYIYNNELCLEEYLELLRTNHKYGSPLAIKGGDGRSYEVYYIDATGDMTELQVSSRYVCEISGDNSNGYIVTVCKSKAQKN